MLVSRTFSWSELVFDYLAGCLMGYFLWVIAMGEATLIHHVFFVFSHGLFALIYWFSDALQSELANPIRLILMFAGLRVGATLWSAALDHASVALGAKFSPAPFLFSFLVAPSKIMFSLVTSSVGVLIWLVALIMSFFTSARVGFAGGVLFSEFAPQRKGYSAIAIGFTTHAWFGELPFKHELYHTRQYIYLSDWLIPFWCLGIIWGWLSGRATQSEASFQEVAYAARGEVGNPLEVAAYKLV